MDGVDREGVGDHSRRRSTSSQVHTNATSPLVKTLKVSKYDIYFMNTRQVISISFGYVIHGKVRVFRFKMKPTLAR